MISALNLQLRAGSRLLLEDSTLRVQPRDRIGLVGRNGAGKTTLLCALAGEVQVHAGTLHRTGGQVEYLPQGPREDDLSELSRNRILSARGLDRLVRQMETAWNTMAVMTDELRRNEAITDYGRLEDQFTIRGGYAAESEAAEICKSLGLPDRVLDQPLKTLSGGQRRRVELARILFAASETGPDRFSATTLLLDEPTNHLDAGSVSWLRDFLKSHDGGLVLVSHNADLLDAVVNKVWFLDTVRCTVDVYNMDWRRYLSTRADDEKRRRHERDNAEKRAGALRAQAHRLHAKATKAVAAKNMVRRAERMMAAADSDSMAEKVANIRLPEPAPCGRNPLTAAGLTKSFGSLEIFRGIDLAIDQGSKVLVLGLNGAGKTTLLRLLAGLEHPDSGEVHAGHGLHIGYYAQEHEMLDLDASVWSNLRSAAPEAPEQQVRDLLGAFLFSGEHLDQPTDTLSGGEKTRLALASLVSSSANVVLLDEPTNNLDPASRLRVLEALHRFTGAVVLVTHDQGAAEALRPERVILLPDGTEDYWSNDYLELVQSA